MPPAIMMMMKMTKRTMIFKTQNQEKWRHFHEKINKCNTAIYFFSFVIIESSNPNGSHIHICTVAVLEISLKWIRNVAPMLKTCVFTIWTCEKKDGCNTRLMWRAMSKNVLNRLCSAIRLWAGSSNWIFALHTKQCEDLISRRIFWKY